MSTAENNSARGRVGAVIVNYNAGDDLINCVSSLREQGVQDIAVSDNGSSDDSLAKLADRFPDVSVSHLPNPGYGGGMNHGAARLNNEIVFIMNPDAAVLPGAVDKLLARLDSDSTIGLVGPRTENPDGSLYPSVRRLPSLVDGIGHATLGMFWANNPFSRRYKMLDWDHDSFRDVEWVSGASMFVRREAFESVGGFDDGFWMYLEDVDLCFRLVRAGWRVTYEPDAAVVHIGGTSTTKSTRPFKFVAAHHESVLRYQRKHATGLERGLYPVIYAGMKVRLAIAWARTELATRRR